MRAALLLLAACSGCVPARSSAHPAPTRAGPRVELGVASALEKLRPGDPLPPGREIALAAARGECESAQIAVRGDRRIAALAAEAGKLGGGVPVRLYRVATLSLRRGSGPEGTPGEWPDPLVPVRDPFFDEERRAFPVAVEGRRLQSIWVELCVPPETRPGEYRGEVRVRDGDRALGTVPVRLRVWPFALPATGTFTAAFGLPTRVGTRALGHPDDPGLARALAAALLRHRISPYTLSADPPDGTCTAERCDLDWSRFDAEVAPVLDGTLVPGVKGRFAEVRIPAKVWDGPEEDLAATLRAWKRHFDARGWSDRLWLYTLDEPRREQFPELRRRARLAKQAGIRVFATHTPDPALEGAVDAWAPNLNLVPERRRGDRVSFSYASCMSHGCDELPAAGPQRAAMLREFRGWPGYAIDRPGTAARAVGWLGWRRGLSGELYYDVLHAWHGRDPWEDVRAFAGNGDGTLLYPGRPAELGGEHGFPVESIRLKIIRDSLEDLELLALARDAGLGALASRTAARLVPSARGFERDPRPWLEARLALGEALARRKLQAGR